ncbi:F-box family protein [Rhynchospora pubera]|uniref:F-box family protein n=1 Tax=Rhynchospora pubera TaxID=906938 RepID=A0AAV8EYX4_9POAL|nr:F-box family protein [Rhynchospora pubera]
MQKSDREKESDRSESQWLRPGCCRRFLRKSILHSTVPPRVRHTVDNLLYSTAMETSPTEPTQIDRLSSLPDALLVSVLSLLPTRLAARTSVLSRRFQYLWKASPAVDISFSDPRISFFKKKAMANGVLLSRQPSNPLLRLHLDVGHPASLDLPHSFISSLLAHAHSLGLRHLTLNGEGLAEDLQPIVCSGFSISSLQSLSISVNSYFSGIITLPSGTTLTRLRSLSIRPPVSSAQVEQLLFKLCCLNHLQLSHFQSTAAIVNLSSLTVKKLELLDFGHFEEGTCSVRLFMPSLEFFYLSKRYSKNLPHIHGGIPLLRKSVITVDYLYPEHVSAVTQLLNCISHVEELSLDLKERSVYPFCNLLEQGKEAPAFPNLKLLDVHMCFHEHNFEAVVSLLHRSPALQSLKLVHKAPEKLNLWPKKKRKMNDWRSKLPRNVDGNYQYAYFSNLHLKENNEGFMKLLNKSSTPKKLKAHN